MLIVCTLFWGLSFPVMKALGMVQQQSVPQGSSWFFASLCVTCRFGITAVILLAFSPGVLRDLKGPELREGIILGLFGSGGIVLQMDALAHADASVVAFLTQCHCLVIPLWIAIRQRRLPSRVIGVCCVVVMIGIAILARVDWKALRLGRGEMETLAAAVLFSGYILALEHPPYRHNRVMHFSIVMFGVMALSSMPMALLTAPRPADCIRAYQSYATLGLLGLLILFCTLGAYMLMNRWQRYLPATQAGLIYTLEPIFASLFVLFLPGWFSSGLGIDYSNEVLSTSLLLGGGLIVCANAVILWNLARSSAKSGDITNPVRHED